MKLTIAGYGTLGHYVEAIFGADHEIALYDPPKQLGREADLADADFVFVSVPTPSLPDGACDTRAVEAIVSLARPRTAIVCQSTVVVGTTQRLIEASGKPIVFVPEYAGEAEDHPYRDRTQRRFLIYGGYEPAVSRVKALYAEAYPQDTAHIIVDPTTAEAVKYMENAFLALKVAFCNEFYDLCQSLSIDYESVRSALALDWRIGESHTFVTAERGYGGKCFPKDVAAICKLASTLGAPLSIMDAAQLSNQRVRAQALATNASISGD